MRHPARAALILGLMAAGCTTVNVPGPANPPARTEPAEAPPRPSEPAPELRADRPGPAEVTSFSRPARTFREVRGLWVVRWTMSSEQQVRDMIADAAAAGFNTLIVQVRGRGDAFYASDLEPRAESLQGPSDFDPLALAVEDAHRRGMAVHAWVNTHLVWGPAGPPESPEHLVNRNPDWLAVPRVLGRELFDVDPRDPRFVAALREYAAERPETVEGIYTSPSHPDVRQRIRDVWMDLLTRYDLDGIHFDYIRFPSADFDYSRGSLERFRAWAARRIGAEWLEALDEVALLNPLAFTTALPDEWDEFRREQITSLVAEIYREVKARRPEVVVSAAVVSDPEAAYAVRFQEWERWLEQGILDIAVPMVYTPDNGRFQTLVRSARVAAGRRERVWAGIGAYLDTLGGTLDKIDLARSEDAGGVILFSYDWAVSDGRGDPADPFLQRLGRERFGSE
jgi:uncharacterized lipoprotein YddW (UPF0748 family)